MGAQAVKLPPRFWVLGTGTNVGKTLVAALLTLQLDADYWKPVQTGCPPDSDTAQVQAWTNLDPKRLHPPRHLFPAPLSPDQAARLAGSRIELTDFHLPPTPRTLVIEGAGGLLVPLNERDLLADLVAQTKLPALLVAASGLGTINHSLLTVAALASRGIPLLGVVFNGPLQPDNKKAVEDFGQTRVIFELPLLDSITPQALAGLATPWKRT